MSPRTQFVAIFGAIVLLGLVLELVRRRKLRIGYSLLWIFTGLTVFVLVVLQALARFLARLIGIQAVPNLLFTAGIALALLIVLGQSLTLTTLWRQNKELAQEQALLCWQIGELETRLAAFAPPQPTPADAPEHAFDPPPGAQVASNPTTGEP
jgi:hypothetical protein